MRSITLFNYDSNSKYSLNILSQLARNSKKVLYIDLRSHKTKDRRKGVGLNVSSFLKSGKDLSKYIISLEQNFDVVKGSPLILEDEFSQYPLLFKSDIFKSELEKLDYDYVIFEVSPTLNLLALNALNASHEVMVYQNLDETSFSYSLASFLKEFNFLYGRKVLLTKILVTYSKILSRKKYAQFVFDFSSRVVSYPLILEKGNEDFSSSLKEAVLSILDDESGLSGSITKRIKFEQECLLMLDRISSQ